MQKGHRLSGRKAEMGWGLYSKEDHQQPSRNSALRFSLSGEDKVYSIQSNEEAGGLDNLILVGGSCRVWVVSGCQHSDLNQRKALPVPIGLKYWGS